MRLRNKETGQIINYVISIGYTGYASLYENDPDDGWMPVAYVKTLKELTEKYEDYDETTK